MTRRMGESAGLVAALLLAVAYPAPGLLVLALLVTALALRPEGGKG